MIVVRPKYVNREGELAVVTIVLSLVAGYSLGATAAIPVWALVVLMGATIVAVCVPHLQAHLPAAGACLGLVCGALFAAMVTPALHLSGPVQVGIFKLIWALGLAFACLATGADTGHLLPELGTISPRGWLGALLTIGLFGAIYWLLFSSPPLVRSLRPAGWALVSTAAYRAVSGGIMDEYIFRALLLGRFLANNRATYALLAQATVYAMLHLGSGLQSSGPVGAMLAFVLALITGYSVLQTRGIGWAFLVHGVYSVIIYLA
ncbi:MAG: CPBP family intramembrane glutamic endopeptidase [Bacillota bacterium]